VQINWGTRVITVYRTDAFMTDLGGNVYEMDTNAFRLALKDEEDSPDGMDAPDTHRHNTTVTVGGVTLAHVLEIINGYTITFDDDQYAVNLKNTNNNIPDVTNVNQVSIRSFNSAGLQVVETGVSGLTPDEADDLAAAASQSAAAAQQATLTRKATFNKAVISPNDLTVTIYDDDELTPIIIFDISSDKRIRIPGH
jgi:hypothetical protein